MDLIPKPNLTCTETLAYLSSLMANGMRLDLEPFSRLLSGLGKPHLAYNTILIGGTNGKGSTASMIASILREAGLCVGLYTSPHLVDVRERIAVNGVMIAPEEFSDIMTSIKAVNEPGLTYFECLTAAAFLHFKRRHVDFAVLEVGMGGRLDATNVTSPLLSVITNVTLEHTQYLGRYLRDIAKEKAGIIRGNGICLTAANQVVVRQTLRDRCSDLGATLRVLGRDFKVRRSGKGNAFSYNGADLKINHLQTTLIGNHQVRNAALAVAAVEALGDRGYPVTEGDIRSGLAAVRWPGRLEAVSNNPVVVLDGAHNPAAVNVLCEALNSRFICRKLIVVFGVLQDKNYRIMLRKLASAADILILTEPNTERAVKPENLIALAAAYCSRIELVTKSADALNKALEMAGSDDLICITGSLYLVGEIKGFLAGETVHRQ